MSEFFTPQGIDMDTTPEIKEDVKVIYIGRLGDLGLGNAENGIPTKLATASEAELHEYGEWLKEQLVPVEDWKHLSCIDGRHCKHNADGSAPVARLRHVSGTGSDFGIALNAEASVLDTIGSTLSLKDKIKTFDEYMSRATGFELSAHLGGCGGLNGDIADNNAINQKPAVIEGVEALMSVPEIQEATGATFDANLGAAVRKNAGDTAQLLEQGGWVGQEYVDNAVEVHPEGVEDLEVKDDAHHGHAEDSIAVIVSKDKTIIADNVFPINVEAIIRKGQAYAGQRGDEGYVQGLIAGFGKHVAVADRLPGPDTPLYVVIG
jgi:hypothetical protein